MILALKMLLVRVDLSGICFVLGVTQETGLEWLRRAAQKAEQINQQLLCELSVTQVQLDEMWNFIERKRLISGTFRLCLELRRKFVILELARPG